MIETILRGRSILDLSTTVAGSYCARLLASMGAEVTKVEAPEGGDSIRDWPPFPEDLPHPEKSGMFLFLNAGKQSITLDITSPTGKGLLLRLIGQADVLVEDNKPGTLEGLGLGFPILHQINPALVLCSVTPFGQTGPYRDYDATDLVTFAMGGISYIIGASEREPLTPRGPHPGFIAGTTTATAILMALYHAGLTGEGQHVDVSIMEALVNILENTTTLYEYNGIIRQRSTSGRISHYTAILPAANGDIGINTTTPQNWETLCHLMDMPELIEDPRFLTGPMRAANGKEIAEIIGPWLAQRNKEELYETAQLMRIPFGMVRTVEDVFKAPQHRERGFFVEVETAAMGRVKVPSLPFRQAGGQAAPLGPAPALGEHNAEVYEERLGLTAEELLALRRARII